MAHRMAMTEAVQPGPQGQAALLSCLTRQEIGARSVPVKG